MRDMQPLAACDAPLFIDDVVESYQTGGRRAAHPHLPQHPRPLNGGPQRAIARAEQTNLLRNVR